MSTQTKIEKGMKIKITDNSIYKMMGYQEVTGIVFLVLPNGNLSIKCDQTGMLEGYTPGDGKLTVVKN